MILEFKTHLSENFSFLNEKHLLIAISGGLDSVVLAHLCKEAQLNFSLAHCNFSLRGIESDKDEQFVNQLAKELGLPLFVKTFQTEVYAKENKMSIQLAARQLRYNWFNALLEERHLDYVLTAHHADDNLETILINLSRGTGIDGLTGIPPRNNKTVRPLLPFTREEIKNYATAQSISWREDLSNASKKYLRNKLRHDVVPLLKEANPEILKNISTTISHLKDTNAIVAESVKAVLKRAIITKTAQETVYKISEFKKLDHPKAYIHQIFKEFGFTAFNDILNLLDSISGKLVRSKTHQLLKHKDTLILSSFKEILFETVEVSKNASVITTENGLFKIELVSKLPKNLQEIPDHTVYIDKDKLGDVLTVRKKIEGDYFYPAGMVGKKKLSKYFKDQKLSLLDKEKTLILCSNDKIVWIVNYRLDNRFKVSKETQNILKITYTP
jgi:tRNA(Ile)-lysidine synthase